MQSNVSGATTVGALRSSRGDDVARESVCLPALTILAHPDLRRVGERVLLGELRHGGEAVLGRTTPEFAVPGEHLGRPLGLRPLPQGGVELDLADCPTAIRVNGEPVRRARGLSAAELGSGPAR
jgi:hypothetical protein